MNKQIEEMVNAGFTLVIGFANSGPHREFYKCELSDKAGCTDFYGSSIEEVVHNAYVFHFHVMP